MSANQKTGLSSPFSSGGGGGNFETEVQTSFVVLMLSGGFAPTLPLWPISKIKLQGKYAGFETDDLIVYRGEPNGKREAKLLAQVKHSVRVTNRNSEFGHAIGAAWRDFRNARVFDPELDSLGLLTGPISYTDMEVRTVLEWARASETAKEFLHKVELAKFSSSIKRQKLAVIRGHLLSANGGKALSEDELWRFLRSFHFWSYDLDIRSSVVRTVLQSLIGQHTGESARAVWALAAGEVRSANQDAGTITMESLSEELCGHFQPKAVTMPQALRRESPVVAGTGSFHGPAAAELTVALLLGGWDESAEGDSEFAAQLAQQDYHTWIQAIRETLQQAESPLELRDGRWTVGRKRELWHALGSRVFDSHLENLRKIAATVLAEPDPKFQLPSNKRYMAQIEGKTLSCSDTLRKGLAETLAVLGSQPGHLTNCTLGGAETAAILVVRELLSNADWVTWGSLNPVLPLLAEAAPEEFLTQAEEALQQSPCPFAELFAQEGDALTGGNYLTGLLWGLEGLAWEEQFLARVTVVLGELSAIDPGGKWSNRPANSLSTIFLAWLPQTTASLEKRKTVLSVLAREVPEVGWQTMLNLLPNQIQSSFGTHKPVWRDVIPDDWSEEVSRSDYWEQVSFCGQLLVEMAGEDRAKLTTLAGSLDNLPGGAFAALLEHLRSSAVTALPEDERYSIWLALIELVARHRRFADAKWALGEKHLADVEEVVRGLAPKRLRNLYRHLFRDGYHELDEGSGDWEENRTKLATRRREAIQAIYRAEGFDGVLGFARLVEAANLVGLSFGEIAESHHDADVLPDLLSSDYESLSRFAMGFVWSRHHTSGWEWVDQSGAALWPVSDVAMFLKCLPFCLETWERAERLLGADEAEYWNSVFVNPYQTEENLGLAVDKLVEHGRAISAVDCLAADHHRKHSLDYQRTVNALLAAASSPEEPHSTFVHHALQLIKAVQDNAKSDPEDIYRIEWTYLPLLEAHRGASPKLLERRLTSDPHFFSEVVGLVFRSKDVDKRDREPTPQQKNLAQSAYRLLHDWKTPPGTLPDGNFSPEGFKSWMRGAQADCRRSGHLEVARSCIGQALVYSPRDPGGLWIHTVIAQALNAKDAEELRRGVTVHLG